jgi:hypothetical protein
VRVEHFTICLLEFQSGSHISITAMLQVRLKEEALDLAALDLLLRLDEVEKELQGAGGSQPGLQ